MTGQHEPLWKPEVKSGAREWWAFPAPHAAPVMMSPMSYQGLKVLMATITWRTDVISHGGHWDTIRECQMMVTIESVNLNLVSVKPW